MKKSFIAFVYIICFIVFNSSQNDFHSCANNVSPKSIIQATYYIKWFSAFVA